KSAPHKLEESTQEDSRARAGPSRGFEFAAFVRVSSGQSSAPHTKATRDRFNLSKVSAGHHANEEMKNGNSKGHCFRNIAVPHKSLVASGGWALDEHCVGHTVCLECVRRPVGKRVRVEAGTDFQCFHHRGGSLRTFFYPGRAAPGQVRAILGFPDGWRAG